jgi:hypothetical protein
MATLSADAPRVFETGHDNMINDLPVIASDIIYDGAAVGESSTTGTYRPIQGGDNFAGFATKKVDNSAGSAGDKNVNVYQRGVVQIPVVGATGDTDNGAAVYATDDDTFTLTASGGSQIGKVLRHVSGTTCMVYFEGLSVRSV